jgi:hypothetical protein
VSAQAAGPDPEHVIKLGNEFTEVVLERVRTGNGARLRIRVPSSGAEILLCPLELEALAWQDHELFSRLLATPNGPESDAPAPEDAAPRPGPPPCPEEPAARRPGPPPRPEADH